MRLRILAIVSVLLISSWLSSASRAADSLPAQLSDMTLTDHAGKNWSYLAATENYNRIRAMHQKNLIVPLVGDFGGPKAVRMAGQYLQDHGAIVKVFYLSNVEDYIGAVWPQYGVTSPLCPSTHPASLSGGSSAARRPSIPPPISSAPSGRDVGEAWRLSRDWSP